MEEPTDADRNRINDIMFGSHFTDDKEKWNEENEKNRIFKADTKYKTNEWKQAHKNAFLNILFVKALELKKNDWNVDLHKPRSVKERSEEYLNKSHDIYSIFKSMFEKHTEDRKHFYRDIYGKNSEDAYNDWTLAKVVSEITGTKEYEELMKDKAKRMEYGTAKLIKEWFKTKGTPLNSYVVLDKAKNKTFLKEWRRFDDDDEEEDETEMIECDDY